MPKARPRWSTGNSAAMQRLCAPVVIAFGHSDGIQRPSRSWRWGGKGLDAHPVGGCRVKSCRGPLCRGGGEHRRRDGAAGRLHTRMQVHTVNPAGMTAIAWMTNHTLRVQCQRLVLHLRQHTNCPSATSIRHTLRVSIWWSTLLTSFCGCRDAAHLCVSQV